ncbi:MAG: hypothetical protein JWR55_1412 [Aeromicrobium sp.]|jgi:hypothetical protein|nr:hypothetical protein [Aeromicrobium sp.]
MLEMHTTAVRLHRQMQPWLRICLNSAVIIGIFAMHQMVIGPADAAPAHHAMPALSSQSTAMTHTADVAASTSAPDPASDHKGDGSQGSMSDCCGLLMLCLSMLVGLAAFIFVRSRASARVLWQLPPPAQRGISLRIPPFHNLSPLQRCSVLRC